MPPSKTEISAAIKSHSRELAFDLCGICPAVAPTGLSRFAAWLEAGYAGQMRYLSDRRQAYSHPRHVLEGARSIVLLAMNYRTAEPSPLQAGQGRVSRYAWGTDYHDVIHKRLDELATHTRGLLRGHSLRGVVDTAPLFEREFAQLAGLGWIGKNSLLLNKELGSWFFLAALLTSAELDYDAPHEAEHCGTCRACLDACPTDAFVAPYVLDSRRCISYATIELRELPPVAMRRGQGDWLFGCDVCQEVCPWNNHSPPSRETSFQPRGGLNPLDLSGLFQLDDAAFRARFRDTPLWRAKRRGLLRNAAIVLGNQRAAEAIQPLAHGLDDPEPLVRAACAWALGQLPGAAPRAVLADRQIKESDSGVLAEIAAALGKDELA